MVCMGRYSHKRDLCGHDVNDAGAYKRYYHRDEMSANSQQLIDKLTTFQVKPSHDSRSLLKNHNQRMEKRGRGISFDFPSVKILGPIPWGKSSGKASTIISWKKNGEWRLVRDGEVLVRELN